MATLKDIGKELGLSVATVSRALNDFPEVKQATKVRVRDAAQRLGYRPNRVAQRLVTGRSGMVGMIVKISADMTPDLTFFETLTGFTAALAARDTDLVLAVDQGADPIQPYIRMLERDILDGFILIAPTVDDPRAAYLTQAGIPFVMHGRASAAPHYPYFDIDNVAVSRDAVQLLAGLGHRAIALINGAADHAFAAYRLQGFMGAMATAGLPVPSDHCRQGAVDERDGHAVATQMLSGQSGTRPTAIICASTRVAAGALQAAHDLGISVPDDVSVMAHDDGFPQVQAATFDPPLTVTYAPLRDACVPLANHLIDVIGGGSVVRAQTLHPTQLIVRGSTGPAPGMR